MRGNYRLDFHGRVKVPSAKNIQLVSPDDETHTVYQFGKVSCVKEREGALARQNVASFDAVLCVVAVAYIWTSTICKVRRYIFC